MVDKIHNMDFKIIDTLSYLSAQVTSGGVLLDELSLNLETKKISNLYVIGEVVDVDGDCGGFNLAWAFNSAIVVSKSISSKSIV